MQCSLVFELKPACSYSSDQAKIAYFIGLLWGDALKWASAVWEKQASLAFTYVSFCNELKKVFDHPINGKDASTSLLSVRQGLRSVAKYFIEFRTLAVESGWNAVSLQAVFIKGLSELLKDELVSYPEPASLDQLIALVIRIDN